MNWRKKTQSEGDRGKIIEKPKSYIVDSEVGRLGVDVFEIRKGSEKVFTTRKDVFPETGSLEAFKTPRLLELFTLFPLDESFRKSTTKLNRVLLREEEEAIEFRTLANTVEREGELIQEQMSKKAETILKAHGFSAEGKVLDSNKGWDTGNEQERHTEGSVAIDGGDQHFDEDPQSACGEISDNKSKQDTTTDPGNIAEDLVRKAIEEINAGKEKELQIDLSELHEVFEDPELIKANISLDDVLSKKQKESNREKGSPSKEKKEFVKNTVAHLQNGENASYILNASGIEKTMILVLAFLVHNGSLNQAGQLIFFIDGAADLRLAIQSLFSDLLSFKIVLDWFHLEKKGKERLSAAMKGKKIRNKVLDHITPLLWHGKIDAAISYLEGLNKEDIKNQEEIRLLIGYLERNRSYIPCYALRQKLGLRVSSNRGEKANDLVVSSRQKHNGMSWSTSGSTSLATVTSLHLNGEQANWFLNHDIPFQFKKRSEDLAA